MNSPESPHAQTLPIPNKPSRRFRAGALIWVLLIGGLAYVQWPMVKGMYYKSTGVAAPASAIGWRTDFDAALAESAACGKPVLVDFTADWCPPCKVMKHEVWPDRAVSRAVSEGYIPLLIDIDLPRNAAIAERYGIRGIPTILVLDAKGVVLHAGMFMSSGDLLKFLKQPA